MTKKIITLVSVFAIAIGTFFIWKNQQIASNVFAVGDLSINWGVPSGQPIFVVTNMLPGDTETRQVVITNNAAVVRPISVRGDLLSETASFSSVIDFVISENGTDLYSGLLADFFAATATPSSIPLGSLNPGATKTYTFNAHFQEGSGNEFQLAQVIFNLIIGIDSEVPDECKDIEFSGPAIFGTSGNDNIAGTLGNDLIFALEGNDRVLAKTGDDCIIGGLGNDELRGEVGKDIVIGNEGNDLVIGANGRDRLFGGSGDDTIRGENDDDYIEGNEGNDTVTGGNGQDTIFGGFGDDKIWGENGNDVIHGENGNDLLDGGNGTDTLIGGSGTDSADGKSGNDTCDAEVEVSCEL